MVNKLTLITIIILFVFSCKTVKKNNGKKENNNNPLLNTCWAIDYKLRNNGDTIKMDMKVNLQFMENGVCNISGMQAAYKLKDSMLYMAGNTYKVINLTENELKLAHYWDKYLAFYEIYHPIDCDSVNEIFKGFELIDDSRKI